MNEDLLELLKELKYTLRLIKRSTYYREGIRQYRPKLGMSHIDDLYDRLVKELGSDHDNTAT